MYKSKSIKMIPTSFILDVYVTDDTSTLSEVFELLYGADDDFIASLHPDLCITFDTDADSLRKGDIAFVIILKDLNPSIVAHETFHLLWHMEEIVGIEVRDESQEWCALFQEYIISKILEPDDYVQES